MMKPIRAISGRPVFHAAAALFLALVLVHPPANALAAQAGLPPQSASLPVTPDQPPSDTGGLLGTIRNMEGAAISFAAVFLLSGGEEAPIRSLDSGRDGTFRIREVPGGRYHLRIQRIGYETAVREVDVVPGEWTLVDVRLERAALEVDEIRVEAGPRPDRARSRDSAGLTTRGLGAAEIRRIPGVAETDLLRAIEVLPGVVSTSDFTSAFNVRGSSADQNLILLDGTPVFNPFHLGGFFSVFNSDMVARAALHSGGFPAAFGGRVSSVLEVESDPGTGETEVDAGLSLLTARVAVAGGIPDGVERVAGFERASWRLSGRRSWADWLLGPVLDFPYYLADVQGVFEGWTPGGHRLTVSGYTGTDVLDLRTNEDFPLSLLWKWGNRVLGGQWESARQDGGFTRLNFGYSGFTTAMTFPDFDDTTVRSGIDRVGGGVDLERPAGSRWTFGTGVAAERFTYENHVASGGTALTDNAGNGLLLAGYLQARWRGGTAWLAEVGVRGSAWLPEPGEAVVLPSPRLALKRFFRDGDAAVSVAVGRLDQFLHSLRDEELPLGLDSWVLAGELAPHVVSDQVQVGVEVHAGERLMISLEAYARTFDGVVTLNPVPDPNDPLDEILAGRGHSWGIDAMVRGGGGRSMDGARAGPGRSGGDGAVDRSWMLAVSWLQASRTFPDVRSGLRPAPEREYPPPFDRRLNVDLVVQQRIAAGIDAGLRWNFGTGLPFTRPLGGFHFFSPGTSPDDRQAVLLGPRNGDRYPAYHRLDMSFRREIVRSWGRVTPHLDILNVYDRRNVLFYHYSFDRDPPTRSGISMFPVLPTFGIEVSF